jgi:bacteriocin biosynthesis cyclodehydratase domain-containing protein
MENDSNATIGLWKFFKDPDVQFPDHPMLVPDLDVFHVPHGLGIWLRGGPEHVLLRGKRIPVIYDFLRPRLNGEFTLEEIVRNRPPQVPLNDLLRTVSLLHTKGLLTEPDLARDDRQAPRSSSTDCLERQHLYWGRKVGWTMNARSGAEVQERIEKSSLTLVPAGLFGLTVCDLLTRSGFRDIEVVTLRSDDFISDSITSFPGVKISRCTKDSADELCAIVRDSTRTADLAVVAMRNASRKILIDLNRICLDNRCAAIFSNDDGVEVELGPFVHPNDTSCYFCAVLRSTSSEDMAVESYLYDASLATKQPAEVNPLLGESLAAAVSAASLVTLDVIRATTKIATPHLLNATMSVNPLTGDWSRHRLLRVPRCPECGGDAGGADSYD